MPTSTKERDIEAYKTIKVPLWVYENAKEIELALSRKGFEAIPSDVLEPAHCPICKSPLQMFTASKAQYVRCTHCGYTQQRFTSSEGLEGGVLGTAIGMSLVYFINALFKKQSAVAS